MTPQEKRAIKQLKAAIRNAHKLGIRLAGMDGSLLYATASAYNLGKLLAKDCELKGRSSYSAVANANLAGHPGSGVVNDDCYEDSGGY